MINRRKGNKIAKKEEKRIRGSINEVHYPNMCAPEMKTGKKKKMEERHLKIRRMRRRKRKKKTSRTGACESLGRKLPCITQKNK